MFLYIYFCARACILSREEREGWGHANTQDNYPNYIYFFIFINLTMRDTWGLQSIVKWPTEVHAAISSDPMDLWLLHMLHAWYDVTCFDQWESQDYPHFVQALLISLVCVCVYKRTAHQTGWRCSLRFALTGWEILPPAVGCLQLKINAIATTAGSKIGTL